MNPDDWNIRPEQQGDGGSSKWNFALLVPMLGVTALRWIYSKKSQKEIEQANIMDCQHLEDERQSIRLKQEALFHEALEKEKDLERKVSVALKDVEYKLVERQKVYCSPLRSNGKKFEIEKDLLVRTAKEPLFAHLEMETGLKDIFENDRICAKPLNTDERRNGSLMWLYLKYWQLQVTLQSHQRAEAAVFGLKRKKK